MKDADRTELIRLLELDYEKTTKLIEGVVGTNFTIRGWGIALISALLGFTFQTQRWEIAVLAMVVTFLIAVMDGYHSWLYAKLLQQAQNVERVLGLHYSALSRGEDDPAARREFEIAILAHRFGRFAEIQKFGFKSFGTIRPRVVFLSLYGTLFAAAILSFFLVRELKKPTATFECKAVQGAANVYVCRPK
jgi:hypothetical protein